MLHFLFLNIIKENIEAKLEEFMKFRSMFLKQKLYFL